MTWFSAGPEAMSAAANNLADVGSALADSNNFAASQTTSMPASAGDQVSAVVARFFGAHAQGYQQISAQMASFHDQFVQALASNGASYANAETAAAAPLQDIFGVINARSQ